MNEEYYMQHAEESLQSKDYNVAIACLDKVLELNIFNDVAHFHKGQCYMMIGNYDEAIAHYKRALEIDSEWAYPYTGIGNCLLKKGRYHEAYQQYMKALSFNQDPEAHFGLGETLTDSHQYKDAISFYEQYTKHCPSNPKGYRQIGEAYRLMLHFETARNYYQKALNLDANFEMTLHRMGETFKLEGNYGEAIKWFQRDIVANPCKEQSYHSIGECLSRTHKYEEGIAYYNQAIRLNPNWSQPYFDIAEALRMIDRHWEAIPWFVKAIELGDDSDQPYYAIAECYKFKEDYQRAIKCYTMAFERKGDYANILYKLGLCYFQLGNYDEALFNFNQSLKLNPKNGELYSSLAEYQIIQGNYRQALHNLLEAYPYSSPHSRKLFLTIGKYLLNLKEMADIEYAIDKILHLYRDSLPDLTGKDMRYQQYTYAKLFLLHAASIYNKDYVLYEVLTYIPTQYFTPFEPSATNYFYHLCFIWKHHSERLHPSTKREIFKMALKSQIPILVLDMALEEGEDFADLILPLELSEPSSHTRSIRKQMMVWQKNLDTVDQVNLYAIFSHCIHNPVAAYDIYTSFLKKSGNQQLNLVGHYYYSLTAKEIIVNHQEFLRDYSIPFVRKKLLESNTTQTDKYYCALILLQGNHYDEGTAILEELAAAGYKAGSYKLAEFSLYKSNVKEADELIGRLSAAWNATEDYYKEPYTITVSCDEKEMMQQIRPLLDVMENEIVLQCIFQFQADHSPAGVIVNNYFSNRYFFNEMLYFPHFAAAEENEYLRYAIPDTYKQVYGSEEEKIMLQPDIHYYRDIYRIGQEVSQHIGEKIHVYSYTLYMYIKNEIEDAAPNIDFRYYLMLISNCLTENLLTHEEAAELQEYTKYCAEQVKSIKPDDHVLEYAYEEVLSFVKSAIQLHSGFDYAERAFKMLRSTMIKNQSELISFTKFRSLLSRPS